MHMTHRRCVGVGHAINEKQFEKMRLDSTHARLSALLWRKELGFAVARIERYTESFILQIGTMCLAP